MSYDKIKTICLSVLIILSIVIEHATTQSNIERADLCSILLNDRIYFAGGLNRNGLVTHDFFYLDLSESFNTKSQYSLPFKEVAKTPFGHRDSALVSANDTIYLFVGTY